MIISICFTKGNNGLSGFNFGPSQFQNLLYLAGYDPSQPPFTAPCGADTDCVLPYLGRIRDGKFLDVFSIYLELTIRSKFDRLAHQRD